MTKEQLIETAVKYVYREISEDVFLTAVEAYSSASNDGKPIVSGSVEFEKIWMMTCIEDALIVADEQDEQWRNADTARISVQKIRKEIPLKYLKATDR